MKRAYLGLCAGVVLSAGLLAAPPEGPQAPTPPLKKLSAAHLINADAVRRQLGLLPGYTNLAGLGAIKVAVLDYDFDGLGQGRPYLPADTVIVEHYDADLVRRFNLGDADYQKPFAPGNSHGRVMAQLAWAMTGNSPHGPHFYLLNANGPTLFARAIRYAIEQRVDIILFAGDFQGAGNYDGRGPINALVDQAVSAGIIWINAAGNYGGCVHNGPVELYRHGYVRLGRPASTAVRFRNLLDENSITVTLTWNDYTDQEDAGTDKDLDLYVEDDQGRVLASSELRQVKGKPRGPGESRNPRERVVLSDLAAAPGREFRIRVKIRSGQFTTRDRLRILVSALRDAPYRDPQTGKLTRPVQLLDASEEGEVYPPADHPGVIAVGEGSRYSSLGPTADGRIKPDVVIADTTAQFSIGEETKGSSNAAAYFAGVAAVLKVAQPGLQTRHLLVQARRGESPQGGRVPEPALPARPQAGAVQGQPSRSPPPHVPWRTPSPARLAELVRQ